MGLNMSLGAAAWGGGGPAALKEFQHRVVTVGAGAAMPTFCWSDVRCQTSKKLPPPLPSCPHHLSWDRYDALFWVNREFKRQEGFMWRG